MPPESSCGVSGRVWIPETAAAGDLEPVGLALLARLHAAAWLHITMFSCICCTCGGAREIMSKQSVKSRRAAACALACALSPTGLSSGSVLWLCGLRSW